MLASSAAVKKIAQREMARNALGGVRAFANLEQYSEFGKTLFTGKVAVSLLRLLGCWLLDSIYYIA
jgi:hypothetical protein